MSTKNKIAVLVFSVIVLASGYKIYDVYFNYRFMEISPEKVYKSGVIPPDKIKDYVDKYHIKSIIDLRQPGTKDSINNPEIPGELMLEKAAIEKLNGVNYFPIPSDQVPVQENLDKYFAVMDNPDNYPVLIHCYHGIGRAQLYSALYRIEYEGVSGDAARRKAAFPVMFSSFDDGTPKGEFLKAYKSRKELDKK
jgi:protein tyrosine/serine phosphatase